MGSIIIVIICYQFNVYYGEAATERIVQHIKLKTPHKLSTIHVTQ